VHHYEPDQDPAGARALVNEVVAGSLTELQLRRQLSIRRAADSLDLEAWLVLGDANSAAGALPPDRRTMGQALNAGPRLDAISRLLELTAIRAEFFRVTGEMLDNPSAQDAEPFVRYRATPFGAVLFEHVMGMMGLDNPQVQEHFRRLAAEGGPRRVG
jgi:hypothetical protein